MKYHARSGKIQEILADMLQTFQDNLAEAEQKESEAQASYEKLRGSKEEEKAATEQALEDMVKEGAARGLSRDEAKAEVEALEEQVANDEKFIADAEAAYATKLEEWKERKRLRTEEIAAISKAIAILRSDDARDLFKKSFESQGGSMALLQEGDSRCSPTHRQRRAAAMMRKTSGHLRSVRLAAIATAISMSTTGHFDEVIAKIDEMISTLAQEEAADLEKKEQCEKDRMENTRKAKKLSQEIDDKSAFIERKEAEVVELHKKIKDAIEQITQLERELAAATENRAAEKAEYETNKADDESAVQLIDQAMAVLQEFYESNGLVFFQGKQAPVVVAGEAPPPPPSTWEEPYGGAKGETNGIIAILEIIKGDIEKDIATATAEEEAAQKEFDEFKKETETSISNLEEQKARFEEQVGDAESALTDAQSQRADLKKVLEDTLEFLKGIAPGCDYIAVNFEIRGKNRQAERDGLEKAKAILQGAEFSGFLQKPC
jgi:chromosome segregation ATPase